jgi:hypothetical protein
VPHLQSQPLNLVISLGLFLVLFVLGYFPIFLFVCVCWVEGLLSVCFHIENLVRIWAKLSQWLLVRCHFKKEMPSPLCGR